MNLYFFIGTNGQQYGPVPAENLKANGVTRETLVWCNGMANWAKAADVPELAAQFAPPIPPVPPVPPAPPVAPVAPAPPVAPHTPQRNVPGQPMVCPDNYLVWAILTTILCCWPLGIPAIVYATKVEKRWSQGDRLGALENSLNAKKWCKISLIGGIATFVFSFIVSFFGAL